MNSISAGNNERILNSGSDCNRNNMDNMDVSMNYDNSELLVSIYFSYCNFLFV